MVTNPTPYTGLTKLWADFTQALLSITRPDHRSLTAFRIVLALGVLLDLWQRLINVPYFYSEGGLLPRELWEQVYGDAAYYWTIHFFDLPWLIGGLLIVQLGLALALLVGFRTRWVSLLSWFLLLSLVLRNPLLFYGGDKLAPILLLIGAFLPLSRRSQRTSLTGGVSRLALLWLLVQMAVLYIASGVAKLESRAWLDSSALPHVLEMNMLVRPLGTWFAQFGVLVRPLSVVTPWAEMVLPLLFFVPLWRGRVRALAILALLGLNVGIQSMIDVGFFMFYASAGLLGLLPPQFWEDLARVGRSLGGRIGSQRGATASRGTELPPRFLPAASRTPPFLRGLGASAASSVILLFIAVSLATWLEGMKAVRLSYPPPSWTVIRGLNVYQNWGLFTHPTPIASWYVSKAELLDGTWVDILQAGGPVVWAHQRAPNALYRSNSKWRVAMAKVDSLADNERGLHEATGRALARYWNDRHLPEQAVKTLTVYSLSQPLPIQGDEGRTWQVWLEWPVLQEGANGRAERRAPQPGLKGQVRD